MFISYSRRDRDFVADELRPALVARSKRVWVDLTDIPPAADWRERIERAVASTTAVLFVISPDSVASPVCLEELRQASESNKRIIPVLRRTVDPTDVPGALERRNWIFITDQHELERGLALIVEALDTDLEWRDTQARLSARATEWRSSDRDAAFLLRGAELEEAEEWLAGAAPQHEAPAPGQIELITSSRQATTQRLRRVIAAIGIALVATTALAAYALIQRHSAIVRQKLAQSRELAATSGTQLAADPRLSLLLAAEAHRIDENPQSQRALREALAFSEDAVTMRLPPKTSVVGGTFTESGRRVAMFDDATHAVLIADARTGRVVNTIRGVTDADFGETRRWAIVLRRGTYSILSLESGRHVRDLPAVGGATVTPEFVAGGEEVALLLRDRVQIQPAQSERTLVDFKVRNVWRIASSRHAETLLTTDRSGRQVVWVRTPTNEIGRTGELPVRGWVSPQQARNQKHDVIHDLMASAVSPDGTAVATLSVSSPEATRPTLGIWWTSDLKRPKLSYLANGSTIAWSPDGFRVLVTALNGPPQTFGSSPFTSTDTVAAREGASASTAAAWSSGGRVVATATNANGAATQFDVSSDRLLGTVDGLGGQAVRPPGVAVSPNGRAILTWGFAAPPAVWYPSTQNVLGPNSEATGVDNRGRRLASGSYGDVVMVETEGGRILWERPGTTPDGDLTELHFNTGGTRLMAIYRDLGVDVHDAANGKRLHSYENGLDVSPDERHVVERNGIRLASRPDFAVHFSERDDAVWARFSANSQRVLTVSNDSVAIWSATAKPVKSSPLWRIRNPGGGGTQTDPGGINADGFADISADGSSIVTLGSDSSTAFLWTSGEARHPVRRFSVGEDEISLLRFSHDGSTVLVGMTDGRLVVYDSASGEELTQVAGHDKEITDAALAAFRISTQGQGAVLLHRCDACLPGEMLEARATAKARRQLTDRERARFLHER